jgi:hypothetical protein
MKIDKSLVSTPINKTPVQVKTKEADVNLEQKDGVVLSSGTTDAGVLSKDDILQLKAQNAEVPGVFKRGAHKAHELGDKGGRILGTVGAVTGGVVGANIGALGGAAAMGIIGLGAGVPTAILGGSQGLSIIADAFSSGNALARAGILAGTVLGVAGGAYLGSKVAYGVGYSLTAGAAIAPATIGEAFNKNPEAIEAKEPKEPARKESKLEDWASKGAIGAGLIMGGTGGLALGGLIGSGAGLTAGIIAKDVALSTITKTGVIGAGIGLVAGAALLGLGGAKLVDFIGDRAHDVTSGLAKGKESVELDMKDKEYTKRIDGLKKSEEEIKTKKADAEVYFSGQAQSLQQAKQNEDTHVVKEEAALKENVDNMDKKVAEKTKEFDSVMAQVQEKTGKQDEIAGHRANERLIDHLKVSEDKYQERKAGLENFEGSMDARDREYDRKNKDMDKIVDNQSDSRVDVTTKELQGKYDARKSSLDSRESDLKVRQDTLDRKKTDMPNLIKQEGDVHYAKREGELKDELSGVEKGLQKDLDGHKQTLQSEYKQKEGQYNSEYSSKKSVVDGKESRVNSMRQDVSHKETQIRDTENKARHNEQEAESILSSIPMEKGRYLDEANRARNEASSLRGQVSGAQSSLSSAQSSANSAQSDYQRSASEFNQLQSDINSLQNQIANAIK